MARERTFEFTGTMQKVSSMAVQGGGVQITLRSTDVENLDDILEYGMQVVEVTLHFVKTHEAEVQPDAQGELIDE